MNLYYNFLLFLLYINVNAFTDDFIDLSFHEKGSAFLINDGISSSIDAPLNFVTTSNADRYTINAAVGFIEKSITIMSDRLIGSAKLHVTVHTFDFEISEETKTLHFLCHASYADNAKQLLTENRNACCIISVSASYFNDITSCVLSIDTKKHNWICRSLIKLPSSLWKQKVSPEVILSYTSEVLQSSAVTLQNTFSGVQFCHTYFSNVKFSFVSLPSVKIAHTVTDAIREIGRTLLIKIPRRELKTNEDFFVTVRLKRLEDVLNFTLRFEIPSNTYVEFVRVIQSKSPGVASSNEFVELNNYSTDSQGISSIIPQNGIHSRILWDVFHRNIVSPKRNVTELVARFVEDLTTINHISKFGNSAAEVYKLQFRVHKPSVSLGGRVAPRILWSLVSLSRRHLADNYISESPVVTRLNIESSELKHITMVLKNSALVNLAVLTGKPETYPVWVYGLTHDFRLVDLTSEATCHTGDDAVIHFAHDTCSKLGFSGAELDGSPGLPLVAKMDGRSASATLLVWFPKAPALKLVVKSSASHLYDHHHLSNQLSNDSANVNPTNYIVLKRLATQIKSSMVNMSHGSNLLGTSNMDNFYQYIRIRIMARFILASSILHDKDVLGGKMNNYVDVTDYTHHRLRLEYMDEENKRNERKISKRKVNSIASPTHNFPVRLLTTGGHLVSSYNNHNKIEARQIPTRVWLVGQHPGHIKVSLAPLDSSLIQSSSIPLGLMKQLQDHYSSAKTDYQFGNGTSHFVLPSLWNTEANLHIRITDEGSVWPVGFSAQLVTDFSMSVDQSFQQMNEDNFWSQSQYYANSNSEHFSVLSRIYSINIQLKGSNLVHSGSINADFSRKYKNRYTENYFKRINSNYTFKSLGESPAGFLLVWIHLSDGSTILWNCMFDVFQKLNGKMRSPFNLSIRNHRPDLFWLQTSSHKKRENRSTFNESTSSDEVFERRRRSHSKPNGISNKFSIDAEENVRRTIIASSYWSGPVVWFKQKGINYSGEILELALVSSTGNVLVPSVQIYANIITPKHDLPMDGYLRMSDPALGLSINKSSYEHSNSITVMQHGAMALKDAPGLWSYSSTASSTEDSGLPISTYKVDQKKIEKDTIYASDVSKLPLSNDYSPLTDYVPSKTHVDQSAKSVKPIRFENSAALNRFSRLSISELSMYILLGLFAVGGLVFAVNCGVIVARYRWDRGRQDQGADKGPDNRQRKTSSLSVGSAKLDDNNLVDYGHAASRNMFCSPLHCLFRCNYKSDAAASGGGGGGDNEVGVKSTRNYYRTSSSFFNKHKRQSLLHRDTNWIWIAKQQVNTTDVDNQRDVFESERLSFISKNCSLQRSDNNISQYTDNCISNGDMKSTNPIQNKADLTTTAVLSVGEADMLLFQSPYCESDRPDYASLSNFEFGTPISTNSQNVNRTELLQKVFMNQSKRHAFTFMQRNYQGEECSIRIISNQAMDPTLDNQMINTSKSQSSCATKNDYLLTTCLSERKNSASLTRSTIATGDWHDNCIQRHSGCASASLHRRSSRLHNQSKSFIPLGEGYVQSNFFNCNLPKICLNNCENSISTEQLADSTDRRIWTKDRLNSEQTCENKIYYNSPYIVESNDNKFNNLQRKLPVFVEEGNNSLKSPWQYRYSKKCKQKQYSRQVVRDIDSEKGGRFFDIEANNLMERSKTNAENENHIGHTVLGQRHVTDCFQMGQYPNSSVLGTSHFDYSGHYIPNPPKRTTSRGLVIHHTLKPKSRYQKNQFSQRNFRPLSLPQSFYVSNELYTTFPLNELLSTYKNNLHPSNKLSNYPDCSVCDVAENCTEIPGHNLEAQNPSEESLWWYHPIKQRRHKSKNPSMKTETGYNTSLYQSPCHKTNRNDCVVDSIAQNNQAMFFNNEPLFVQKLDNVTNVLSNKDHLNYPTVQSQLTKFTKTSMKHSSSDVQWDQDLLSLSHDCLIAYFAQLKESTA